jgi:meso-butanediol dehydrogenase/(S,S)-butanediol dehydrogenase/diacetyl reductase
MELVGKNILVVGAGRGIGKATALALAREGANVAAASLHRELADQTAEEVRKLGRKSISIQVDVAKKDSVRRMIEEAAQEFATIHIFCNNAGVSTMNKVVDLSEEEWDFNMDVNAKGMFFCCQEEAKLLIRQGFGKIINTASVAGKRGAPFLAHYCASKYAVIGFSKALALELAPLGITVNCVCPGLVKTDMQAREIGWEAKLRGLTPEQVREEYVKMTPLGRLEEPEDVAKLFVFLASPYSDFMTGQAINISGGIETN